MEEGCTLRKWANAKNQLSASHFSFPGANYQTFISTLLSRNEIGIEISFGRFVTSSVGSYRALQNQLESVQKEKGKGMNLLEASVPGRALTDFHIEVD